MLIIIIKIKCHNSMTQPNLKMIPLIITCIAFNLAYVMYVSYQFNKMHQAALDLKAQMKAEIALRDAIILNVDSKI